MKLNRIFRTLLIVVILGSNIGCDQISKSVVRERIQIDQQFGFIDNHVLLMKVENPGAFLSLGDSLPRFLRILLLTIIPVIVLSLGFIYVLAKKTLSKGMVTGACFVIGGGVGNIYDRIVYVSVTDFLHIDFGIFRTGIFNMADVSILVGAFIIVLDSQISKPEEKINQV